MLKAYPCRPLSSYNDLALPYYVGDPPDEGPLFGRQQYGLKLSRHVASFSHDREKILLLKVSTLNTLKLLAKHDVYNVLKINAGKLRFAVGNYSK